VLLRRKSCLRSGTVDAFKPIILNTTQQILQSIKLLTHNTGSKLWFAMWRKLCRWSCCKLALRLAAGCCITLQHICVSSIHALYQQHPLPCTCQLAMAALCAVLMPWQLHQLQKQVVEYTSAFNA
jgi:hypothetical protein